MNATVRYKLTTRNVETYNGFRWLIGEWVKTDGDGPLCTKHWTHWYDSPEVAALLNVVHGDYIGPLCWRGETRGKVLYDYNLKVGVTEGRILEQVPLPEIGIEQRVEIAIRRAELVCDRATFREWADGWLSHRDRSAAAADETAGAIWLPPPQQMTLAEILASLSASASAHAAAYADGALSAYDAAEAACCSEYATWDAASAIEYAAAVGVDLPPLRDAIFAVIHKET